MRKRVVLAGIAGAVLAAGPVVATAGSARASQPRASQPRASQHRAASFGETQQQLEQQLTNRVSELARLTTDVGSSTTLTPTHKSVLQARLATETSNIDALVAKVPTDTTQPEIVADRAAMLGDNRVFAVETPQVIQIIEADGIATQVASLKGDEPALQSSVSSIAGQPGYQNALGHYDAFVAAVGHASGAAGDVVAAVLPQVPLDFPGDTHVFVTANHRLLNADVALAHATYDASVIGLATGGYTGS